MSYLNMDLNDVPTGMGFDPVPAGDYPAQIVDSEVTSSKQDNMMLTLTWLVIEGEYAERMIFDRAMLSGSEKSVAFGKRRLKTIADAIGHPNPNRIDDSAELHGLPCLITVTVRKGNEGYSDSNEVKDYKSLSTPNPHAPAAATPANTPPAKNQAPPNTKNTPPPAQAQAASANTPPPNQKAQTPFDPPPAEADVPL